MLRTSNPQTTLTVLQVRIPVILGYAIDRPPFAQLVVADTTDPSAATQPKCAVRSERQAAHGSQPGKLHRLTGIEVVSRDPMIANPLQLDDMTAADCQDPVRIQEGDRRAKVDAHVGAGGAYRH